MSPRAKRKSKGKLRRERSTLASAVAHPTRVKALATLGERVASPAEIAKEVGEDVGKVGYHVAELAEQNLVEEVGCRPVRGTVEHFYKGIELPSMTAEQEAEMSEAERNSFAENVVAIFAADVSAAVETGTYVERTDHHMTRTVRNVDAEGFEALKDAYMDLFDRANLIFEEAAERMGKKKKPKAMRVLSFQAMMALPRAPKGEAPALSALLPPISSEAWDNESESKAAKIPE